MFRHSLTVSCSLRMIGFLLVIFAGSSMDLRAQTATTTYCNDRYGYCLEYLPTLLKPQPEAGNGDGRVFTDAKGHEKLSVYGTGTWTSSASGTKLTLKQLYDKELSGYVSGKKSDRLVVNYHALKDHWFVLSGTQRGEIIYLKVVKRGDAFFYARLHYLPSEAAIYQQTATLISRTFN